ncbi:hypothetical protein NO2_1110 [Candidatus Termititenax persephonae]|uniref:Uncharacterized protein n=1 Tax=Candidatus Termititenax persephonae TaxID=2218525 RepID=A0A388THG1_9BACT|nr:hypothetical protein NO2_1110 [Candidatus Termititenax persephonae]
MSTISGVSGTSTQTSTGISSIKDLENNPEFFPIWAEEIRRRNVNLLISASDSLSSSGTSSEDSLFGGLSSSIYSSTSTGSNTDFFSALGLTSSTDSALSSLFSTQSITADFSFLTPSASLASYQVEETLRGLQAYTNLTENLKWSGQYVEYIDPVDGLLKTGRVTKIDIENVSTPTFKIDDKTTIALDAIQSIVDAPVVA